MASPGHARAGGIVHWCARCVSSAGDCARREGDEEAALLPRDCQRICTALEQGGGALITGLLRKLCYPRILRAIRWPTGGNVILPGLC